MTRILPPRNITGPLILSLAPVAFWGPDSSVRASNTCLAGFFAILAFGLFGDAAAAFLRIRKPRPVRTRLGRDIRIRAGAGCGSTPMVPFWGRFYFRLGLGCSLGANRAFDPWPVARFARLDWPTSNFETASRVPSCLMGPGSLRNLNPLYPRSCCIVIQVYL